jgi:hypothetical protein
MMFEEQAARTLCLEQGGVTLLQAKPGQHLPCPQGVHPAHMLTSDARAGFAASSGMLVKDILMRLNVRPETSVFSAAPQQLHRRVAVYQRQTHRTLLRSSTKPKFKV